MTVLILDTETTGLPISMDEPYNNVANWPHMLSIAWKMYKNDTLFRTVNYIVEPRVGVVNSPGEMAVNGITPEYQGKNGVPMWFICAEILSSMSQSDVIVAHNVQFDQNIIGAELARAGIEMPHKRWICTKEDIGNLLNLPPTEAQRKYRPEINYKQPSLDELYMYLFNTSVPGRETHHGAAQDAAACAECFWELVKRGNISL